MEAQPSRRRTLLGGTAALVAGFTAGFAADSVPPLRPTPAAARIEGAWTYVPPGGSIQDALDSGAKAIMLGAGEYEIDEPILPVGSSSICGVGQQTRLIATDDMPTMIAIGNGKSVGGVSIADLVLDCRKKAEAGIDLNISGTDAFYKGEPDAICRLDNLAIFDPELDGIVYRGTDTQSCVTSRTRVRRAGRYGFRIHSPDNWWIACEATTRESTGSSAGFYVGGELGDPESPGAANNFFEACKAWFCRDYGWHIRSNRCKFSVCEAQDTGSHGWFVETDHNVFIGCVADSAGMERVGGKPGTADGFHLLKGENTALVGCQSFDRQPFGQGVRQRHGFNVPRGMVESGQLSAVTGWDTLREVLHER